MRLCHLLGILSATPSLLLYALHSHLLLNKPSFIALYLSFFLCSLLSNFMASTSKPQLEELTPSTSTSGGSSTMPSFVRYEPPTTKLAFQSDKMYHVFLSFRGEDVRKTLVDHLFQALSAAGLNVFLDSEKLKKGEMVWETLEKAIKSSAICIPIFSKGYANSAWCLREAVAMLSSPGLIIPLFYHVDPTHVRYAENESSPYKQAFLKHYSHSDRYARGEIDRWKNALLQICERSGWSMDITQGFEAQLVKMVVTDLIKTLDRVPLEVAKHPVGLDSVKNLFIQKLNLNSMGEVRKVGIWGIGGIGKTTVAKAVYSEVYTDFRAASFVSDVRTIVAEAGLTKLQKKVLKDLSQYNGEVDSVDEGISLFRNHLGGKRVLLILDDVDAAGQLNALVGDWLAPGSRVVITSRDKHILILAPMSLECIHEMSGLETNEGLELFSWHAFLKASPSPNFVDLSKRIVEACKGHPLSLEVLGSFLYGKQNDIGCWTEALQNITLNPEIHKRLYISYGALSDNEKDIFIDIACFFIGEHKSLPIVFWKSFYPAVDIAVSNLSMKLLIKLDDKGKFDMHDHLRDLGRTIAEKEREGTRLWKENHSSTLSNNINVSHLRLNGGNPQRLQMLYPPSLCYLHLQNVHIEDMTEDTLTILPPSLIWLRFQDCTVSIGKNIAINKILTTTRKAYRALRMKGHSKFVGNVKQLKILQLNNSNIHSLSQLFSLVNVKQMQHLDLRRCVRLNKLPNTIGNLTQLQHLDLEGSISLYKLSCAIGNLSQLRCLKLGGCKSLRTLPDTIGNLSQLQHLNLKQCESLKILPDTVGNLFQLQHLDLQWCILLNELPDTIGNLSQLQHLDLGSCRWLKTLPDTVGNLSRLQHLNLEWFETIENLPVTIGNLSELQHLDLQWCKSLNNLPDTIGNLSQLQRLDLGVCGRLNNLPETIGNMSWLQHLDLRWCERLNNLPNTISNLSHLRHLSLRMCKRLNNLPDTIGNLSRLHFLNLDRCGRLNNLPDTIGNLLQLQTLYLAKCERLNNLPDTIGNLSQLQQLILGGCGRLNKLPDTIGNLSQLWYLNLRDCERLNYLPDTIGNLSQLQHLDLRVCKRLNKLPDTIGNLSQLQHLNLRECERLDNLPDTIGNLSQLRHLDLRTCARLNYLPDTIGNLSQLQRLDLRGCGSLKSLSDSIGNLLQLQHLNLRECERLNNLPDTIGNLSQLQHLDLRFCKRLNKLPDTIGNLSQLQHLNLRECERLDNLPDTIGNLSQLRHLDLRACARLNNLPDTIGNLSQLHFLRLEGCEMLNNPPEAICNLPTTCYAQGL